MLIVWIFVSTGLLGLLLLADEKDITASAAGPTYINSDPNYTIATTWTEANSPYVLNSTVSVKGDAKLTIEPGVIVKFNGYHRIRIGTSSSGGYQANLWAVGTHAKKIVFTSYHDDTEGGDTNGNGDNTGPDKGNWLAIHFDYVDNNNLNKMEYCAIKYANYGIQFDQGEIPVSRCNISHNNRGIYAVGTSTVPSISNCNITNNTYGIYLDYTSGSTSLQSNLIRDNSYGLACNIVPTVSGNTIINNSVWSAQEGRDIPYDVCLRGDVSSTNTWYSSLSPYVVIDHIKVHDPYMVTIEAGTTLKFDGYYYIRVDGKLTAEGTANNRITFTSNRLFPGKGDWEKIWYDPDNAATYDPFNKLKYCTIEYAAYGVVLTSSSPALLDHNNVTNNTYGFRLEGDSDPQAVTYNNFTKNTYSVDCTAHIPSLGTNNFTDNTYDNVTVGGDIWTSCTWPESESPYIVRDNVRISGDDTLTIDPGVTLKFTSGKYIMVGTSSSGGYHGNLWAVGTAQKRIIFTSNADDSEGGDTNGDGGFTQPMPNDWGYINFKHLVNNPSNKLEYCTVKYSNYGAYITGGEVSVSHCNFSYNVRGIYAKSTTTKPTISNCNVSNNTVGIYLESTSGLTELNSNLIRDNEYGIICSIVPNVNGNTIVNNSKWSGGESRFIPYDVCLTGSVSADNTWYSSLSPYVVIGHVTITNTHQVTVQAGTTIKFDGFFYLRVDGKLSAIGTGNDRIIFTSNRVNRARGDWDKIWFEPDNAASYDPFNKLQYCDIEFATYGALMSSSSPALIDHNDFNNNTYGIRMEGNSKPLTVTNNNFTDNKYPVDCSSHIPALGTNNITNNDYDDITVGGYVGDNAIWPESGSPYIVRSDVLISGNLKLTIDPGVVIKIMPGKYIKAGTSSSNGYHGDLYAVGTQSKRIIFTSIKDDTVAGDTNGDGPATQPNKGDWAYIYYYYYNAAIFNKLEYCTIRYANYGVLVDDYANDITIRYSRLEENNRGIHFTSLAKCTVQYNEIRNNDYGIYYDGSRTGAQVNNNDIYGNTNHGVYVHGSSSEVDGTNNYWGHSTGPLDSSNDTGTGGHFNPNGLGDTVTDKLDYTSWKNYYVMNDAPVSNAGSDQTEVWANEITLNGKGSSDDEECPNGDAAGNKLVYDWNASAQYPSNAITLDNESSPTPKFTMLSNVTGTYTFTLVVQDPGGRWSQEDTIHVYAIKPYEPAQIWINELNPAITADETFPFSSRGKDTYGNNNYTWAREWNVTDPWGSIDANGVYTPGKAGNWVIFCNYSGGVTQGGLTVFTQVTVNFGEVVSIDLAPNPENQRTINADQQLPIIAKGFDADGNENTSWIKVWKVTDPEAVLTVEANDNRKFIPHRVGQWTIYCNLTDTNGFTIVTSKVKINVTIGNLHRIDITPKGHEITAGETIPYNAVGYDQRNNTLANNLWNAVWGEDDPRGTIDENTGLYASSANGTWTITCRNPSGSVKTNTTVTVKKGDLAGIEITPVNATMLANETLQFSARGFDSQDNTLTTPVQWDATGGQMSSGGLFTPQETGAFKVYANFTTFSAWTFITVQLGGLYSISISTQNGIDTINVEQTLQFSAKGYDIKGNEYPTADWVPHWSVNDLNGSISSTGLYEPGPRSVGIFTVTCTDPISASWNTMTITVTIGTLKQILISPTNPTITTDDTLRFNATGYDSKNNTWDITDICNWSVTGGKIENGKFTPSKVGKITVYANISSQSGATTITVTLGKLVRIVVSPGNPTIDVFDTVKLKGTGYDNKGNVIDEVWNWGVTDPSGNINTTGKETTYAPGEPGKWTVTCSLGSVQSDVTVEVTNDINITHPPPKAAGVNKKIIIRATIVGYTSSVKLFYKYHDGDEYDQTGMTSIGGNDFEGTIPGAATLGYVYYFIEGGDSVNPLVSHPPATPRITPHTIEITQSGIGSVPSPVQVWVWDLGIGDSVKVLWSEPDDTEGVDKFHIYYSLSLFDDVEDYESKNIIRDSVEDADGTDYSHNIKKLKTDVPYYFAVTAVNAVEENTHVLAVKSTPTKSLGFLTVSWEKTDDPANFAYYEIHISDEVNFEPSRNNSWARIKEAGITSTTITGLEPDKEYTVIVRSIDTKGNLMNKSVGQLIAGKKEEIQETWLDFLSEYWEMALAGLSILAAVFGFLVMQRKKRLLTNYRKEITNVYMISRNEPAKCLDELKEIRQRMETDMHDEKLTENHYLILREKLKDYISEMKEKEKKRKKKEKKKRMKEMRKALVPVETKSIEVKGPSKEKPKKSAGKDEKDYHEILGVGSDATEKEIKTAHKKLAEKYHPDKVRHLGMEIIEVASKNMRELNEARDTLLERLRTGETAEEEAEEEAEEGAEEGAEEEETEKLAGVEEKESLPRQELIDEGKLLGTGEMEGGDVKEVDGKDDMKGETEEEKAEGKEEKEEKEENEEKGEEEKPEENELPPKMTEAETESKEEPAEEEKQPGEDGSEEDEVAPPPEETEDTVKELQPESEEETTEEVATDDEGPFDSLDDEDDDLEELLNSTTEAFDE